MPPSARSFERPGLTTARTLRRGAAAGHGVDGAYYRLAMGPGEAHRRRLDLASGVGVPGQRTSLLQFIHCTDVHLIDAESPGRYEFADRFHGQGVIDLLLPAYRPQEFLQIQAFASLLRGVQAIGASPVTSVPVQLLLCTGDYTDNGQLNELRWFAGLMGGGDVTPGSGGARYEGVGAAEWDDAQYWLPEGQPNEYARRWGFPTHPGLHGRARRPFQAAGVTLPWLSCRGNHDGMVQGTALPNPEYERIVTGGAKTRMLTRASFDPVTDLDLFIRHPEAFLDGPTSPITPDPARRPYTRREFIQMYLDAGGTPRGHGFGARRLAGGAGCYVDDSHPPVRLIVLDTVNPGGHYLGSVGAGQLAWLEERLAEVSSRYWDALGRVINIDNEDRLVVIASHHGIDSLVNDRAGAEDEDDLPRLLGPEVAACLHRFPNVALWVNGHTHQNTITPRSDPSGRTAGFWEVTTGSLLDWPCQTRLVELVRNDDRTLSVLCTMIDHPAPADPREGDGIEHLAALHRELAANDPYAGIASSKGGRPEDRNAELVWPLPTGLISVTRP